ncbi:MAG TPA: hypothetical protein VFR78_13095 [Pyrinomonadaceae bacterium]|nr:hypothetical protein [Pyrinomonadaceae bacterium]
MTILIFFVVLALVLAVSGIYDATDVEPAVWRDCNRSDDICSGVAHSSLVALLRV